MLRLGRLRAVPLRASSCKKAAASFAAALSVLNVTTRMASRVKLSMHMYFKDSVDKDAFMLTSANV